MPWILIGHMSVSHWDLRKVVSIKLYGIGHALSKTELDATPKRCMKQSFSVGYMVNHDTSFMLYTTKLHRVAQPLGFLFCIIWLAFWSQTVTLVTSFQFTLHCHYLGDNCIQNVHLGRYIICYMVGNFVLRRRFSRTIKHIIDDIPSQMKILNIVIPILINFLTFVNQRHSILHQTEALSAM